MAIFDRLFGRHKEEPAAIPPRPSAASAEPAPTAATLDDASRLSLQLLFKNQLSVDAFDLTRRLCSFHPAMNLAMVDVDAASIRAGSPAGRARWGEHAVDFVGDNHPLDAFLVASCIASSPLDAQVKQDARTHGAHIRLAYTGKSAQPIEQYTALAAVAGTLGSTGAVAVLNQRARGACSIDYILPANIRGDRMEYLRTLAVPRLYAGFVEVSVAGRSGVWIRTFGCDLMDLPNLAMHAPDQSAERRVFDIFTRVYDQILKSQRRLEPDATMMVAHSVCLGFRPSSPKEFFLHDSKELLVVEELDR